ncbi:lysozyme inhibitor LprI family protein [Sphingobium sp.]|uniref:lysozyme inhibitor LprI family protein n=1 Tax=Sphingobium sp. TaxID=1912891 RepID=UPI003BB6AEB6
MLLILLAAAASCANAQTQSQMTQCAAQAYASADAAMTRQWKVTQAAMKRLDARDTSRGGGFGYAAALLASQRAWLAYRDRQCVIAAGEFAGGSMQPMAAAQCKERLTHARTKELKALIWRR